jgi:hypothetical protein
MKKTLIEEQKRIFQIMSQIDGSFKSKLNEAIRTVTNDAGEPIGTEYEPDEFDPQDEPEDDGREFQQYHGLGEFNSIDWNTLYEQLLINTELLKAGETSDETGVVANVGDLTDYDGMLNPDELKHLEDWQLIYIDGSFPIIDNEKYLDFDAFKAKALEIWKKEPPNYMTGKDSETPFLRGTELDEGNAFVFAAKKAKEDGKDAFEFEGKTYKVNESIKE